LYLSCKNRKKFPSITPLEKLLVTLSPGTYIIVMVLADYRRVDQRTWYSSCNLRACLVYRRVLDQGVDWGWSLRKICRKKVQYFPRKVYYSFSGQDKCYLLLRLLNSNEW
jgi:hypothetical protein